MATAELQQRASKPDQDRTPDVLKGRVLAISSETGHGYLVDEAGRRFVMSRRFVDAKRFDRLKEGDRISFIGNGRNGVSAIVA